MGDIQLLQLLSLMVLAIWLLVSATTVPFLVIAASGHRRSTLMTVAILALLGLAMSATLYDSARQALDVHRSPRLWADLYAARATSLLMAVTLGWRVWRVMLSAVIADDEPSALPAPPLSD